MSTENKHEIEHVVSRTDGQSIQDEIKQRDEPKVQRQAVDTMTVRQAAWAYRKVGLFCLLAAFSASLDGYQGSLNGSITSNQGFIRQFGNKGEQDQRILDGTWTSIWGGMTSTFQTIAPFCMPFINDRFGRRVGLWVAWVLLLAAVIAESLVRNNAGWMGAKFFAGAGIGAVQSTLPLYINELSPTQIRGLFTEAYTFWYVIGQLMASVSLQRLNKTMPLDYLTAIYTQFGMLGMLGIIYFFLPETPWYLVSSGKYDKARALLQRLKSNVPGYDVDTELAVLQNTIEEQRARANVVGKMPLRMIFQGLNLKRLVIALWPKLTQQAVGLSVFNNYSTYFFQSAGFADPFLISVILTCCQIISMIITMICVDTVGRRPLAVYGYLITVLADFGMAGTGFSDVSKNNQLAGVLVFFACLATFTTTSSSAIGYAYMSEIPKQDFRAKSAGWCLGFSNIFSIMFSFITPIMIKGNLKTGGNFAGWGVKTAFFFGCLGGIIASIGWFIVPETARRTPAEIDEMFEKRVNLRKFRTYVTDVQKEQQAQEEGYRA